MLPPDETDGAAMFANRLDKNAKRLRPWARRLNIEAFRLYDRDIPEFPFIVDIYGDCAVVYDRGDERSPRDLLRLPLALERVGERLSIPAERVFVKSRARQRGPTQYSRLEFSNVTKSVCEGSARFHVNLSDYLDTGLFLDHRLIRQEALKTSRDKVVLNLFSYTGSISVFAALGGARKVTSVDMSGTYLAWAQENFLLNRIPLAQHCFLQADVIDFLNSASGKDQYDLIFLDPPTFSNSKRMAGDFEVERDQAFLVTQCMKMLKPTGALWFSCNKRTFKLDGALSQLYRIVDTSAATIPFDFRDRKIHCAFKIEFFDKGVAS